MASDWGEPTIRRSPSRSRSKPKRSRSWASEAVICWVQVHTPPTSSKTWAEPAPPAGLGVGPDQEQIPFDVHRLAEVFAAHGRRREQLLRDRPHPAHQVEHVHRTGEGAGAAVVTGPRDRAVSFQGHLAAEVVVLFAGRVEQDGRLDPGSADAVEDVHRAGLVLRRVVGHVHADQDAVAVDRHRFAEAVLGLGVRGHQLGGLEPLQPVPLEHVGGARLVADGGRQAGAHDDHVAGDRHVDPEGVAAGAVGGVQLLGLDPGGAGAGEHVGRARGGRGPRRGRRPPTTSRSPSPDTLKPNSAPTMPSLARICSIWHWAPLDGAANAHAASDDAARAGALTASP